MKITFARTLGLVAPFALLASPAVADHHAESEVEANDAQEAAALTIDTPIEALMADEGAKAVVLESLPALDEHPAYRQFKGMTLKQLQPMSMGMITDEVLTKITEGLAALG